MSQFYTGGDHDMAGRLNDDWLCGARCNETADDRVEDWICRAGNFRQVEIDADRAVAANDVWLDQGQIDLLCSIIDGRYDTTRDWR